MKKKLSKRLILNKKTISILQNDEMKVIKGASLLFPSCDCDTASCSVFVHCCDPETKEQYVEQLRDNG